MRDDAYADDENIGRFAQPKASSTERQQDIPSAHRIDPPHRNLLAAILARGISDAAYSYHGLNDAVSRQAQGWLRSESEDPWSFIWICGHLDLCPILVRMRVMDGTAIESLESFRPSTKRTRREIA